MQTISSSTIISLLASIIVRWCLGRIHFGLKLGTAFAPCSRATARKAHEKNTSLCRNLQFCIGSCSIIHSPMTTDQASKPTSLARCIPQLSVNITTRRQRGGGGGGDSTSTANAEGQNSHGGKVRASCESDWMWPMAARREPDELMQ